MRSRISSRAHAVLVLDMHDSRGIRNLLSASRHLILPSLLQRYLHQSRHEHAVKRVRGPKGRFLTASERASADYRNEEDTDSIRNCEADDLELEGRQQSTIQGNGASQHADDYRSSALPPREDQQFQPCKFECGQERLTALQNSNCVGAAESVCRDKPLRECRDYEASEQGNNNRQIAVQST